MVEHNIDMLMNFCDVIHVMNKGKIVASGTPDEIQNNEMVIDVYLGGWGEEEGEDKQPKRL